MVNGHPFSGGPNKTLQTSSTFSAGTATGATGATGNGPFSRGRKRAAWSRTPWSSRKIGKPWCEFRPKTLKLKYITNLAVGLKKEAKFQKLSWEFCPGSFAWVASAPLLVGTRNLEPPIEEQHPLLILLRRKVGKSQSAILLHPVDIENFNQKIRRFHIWPITNEALVGNIQCQVISDIAMVWWTKILSLIHPLFLIEFNHHLPRQAAQQVPPPVWVVQSSWDSLVRTGEKSVYGGRPEIVAQNLWPFYGSKYQPVTS